jgi:hypothetical protein
MVGVLRINPKDSDIFAEPFRVHGLQAGRGHNVRYDFVWADMRIEEFHSCGVNL